ncbi:MAG: phospho-N-acetylmuramoyl-pentapeptide-transferase [Atopobiaceae bacterium]|jgi:phospho-N-acetylmuramoyl-pentapeptide-transferase|nr:phospho-N-acetylmuramoyl-pentapeptide-transferase [Atopobiaceae bacterium]MCH4180468.1 phospho-N-acetylmuramoyl-pentapeptide-transferase [Atopobiaceae bacterium]MCH4214162.1 phospho-N-acetylmuramoyl-pentapeptide-transferase [Atopobiaceae bacterium]MCH4229493.1 phospho-N-acetylmuramoyl-pentapeptide-transferase [Atopobiaceae bacterium]MCH4275828.1 phospho-N-acetylmuramoyl-pentapeptide-transferase [Atopobiaceae bacterium]
MLGDPVYPSYTVLLALLTAALFVIVAMPPFTRFLRKDGIGQQVRADGPQTHLVKQGTPTMGGVILLAGVLLSCILFGVWRPDLVCVIVVTFACALLGLLDDIESVSHGRSLGLTASQKMIGLGIISFVFCIAAVNWGGADTALVFPGGFTISLDWPTTVIDVAGTSVSIPWLYALFVFLLLAGMSNAVNLTDGLDGLAAGTVLVVMLFLTLASYIFGSLGLSVFAAAIAGACIGFLWYNTYPASIFMGDTGSLALGAAFAGLCILTNNEVTSLIMGGLFIVEALSVIIQVVSFKLTGKRVFLMAPLHHHFEKKGWSETKVVIRFWIVSAAFAALGFALYFQLG